MESVLWLSAGVSSAVAWILSPASRAIYIDIADQHQDSMRFCNDVAAYMGKRFDVLSSPIGSVDAACRLAGYINGPGGARCTKSLKRAVRAEWEQDNNPDEYVWGLDCGERHRAERIIESMPNIDHRFPLIENNMTKQDAHGMLARIGIKRPAMYDLGYSNNNCIGCVKGGMGYWNKIKRDFPEVFASRAAMEDKIGATCINGKRLADLKPGDGREEKDILEDCGVFCILGILEAKKERALTCSTK
jgi:hypothetical protein